MKRLVIDARESGTSTGRYVDKLVENLAKLQPGFEVIVLTKTPRLEQMKRLAPAFDVQAADYKEFTFAEQLGFKRHIKRLRPDLVHFSMPQQPVWYRGSVVTTIHDLTTIRFINPGKNQLVFKLKQQVYKYVIKRVVRKSAALIAISEYIKNDLVDYTKIDASKVTVTLEAADAISDTTEPLLELEGRRFLMYVGRPTPHKNLERLIEAFVSLKSSHPDLLLVLAGKKDANYRRIEAAAQKRNLQNIVFTDFVSEGQLRWLYENCEAYVFPSLSEGFGLPGLEAMTHGAPVVSSNATCLPEVYGEAAHYFDPMDVQDMADRIEEVLTDKNLRQELVQHGHEQVKKYSWQRMAEQTLAVYKRLLED